MFPEKNIRVRTRALKPKAVAKIRRVSRLRSASRVMRAGEQRVGTPIKAMAKPIWRKLKPPCSRRKTVTSGMMLPIAA